MEKAFMTRREIEIYEAGVADGIKQMEDKIVHQYSLGQPIMANGRVWFIKSDIDNLNEIFSDIQTTWEKEHGTKWKDKYATKKDSE